MTIRSNTAVSGTTAKYMVSPRRAWLRVSVSVRDEVDASIREPYSLRFLMRQYRSIAHLASRAKGLVAFIHELPRRVVFSET